jgi:hypothetical protein
MASGSRYKNIGAGQTPPMFRLFGFFEDPVDTKVCLDCSYRMPHIDDFVGDPFVSLKDISEQQTVYKCIESYRTQNEY